MKTVRVVALTTATVGVPVVKAITTVSNEAKKNHNALKAKKLRGAKAKDNNVLAKPFLSRRMQALGTVTQTEAMGVDMKNYDCTRHILYEYFENDACSEDKKLEKIRWFEVGDTCAFQIYAEPQM